MTIAIRTGHTAAGLRQLAQVADKAEQARRLLALALVLEGASRAAAARAKGMDRQTLCDWVHRLDALGPDGLIDRVPPGRSRRLNSAQLEELKAKLEAGPDPEIDDVVRWRLNDLCHWALEQFAIDYRERGMGKIVRALGFRRISARPAHPKADPEAQAVLEERLPEAIVAAVGDQALGKKLEIWFQDESRIGQKGELTRQWARRGTRPRQAKDQRYAAAYLLSAVCPASEKAAALVLPRADTAAMSLHLAEIATVVGPDAHAVLILDGAGWHSTKALVVPTNLTLLPLPPYSPELNPVVNIWQYLKHNHLNNRVFPSCTAILDVCCQAWNRLRAIKGLINSITTRDWARTVSV